MVPFRSKESVKTIKSLHLFPPNRIYSSFLFFPHSWFATTKIVDHVIGLHFSCFIILILKKKKNYLKTKITRWWERQYSSYHPNMMSDCKYSTHKNLGYGTFLACMCFSSFSPKQTRREEGSINVLNTFSFFSPPPTRKQDRDFFFFFLSGLLLDIYFLIKTATAVGKIRKWLYCFSSCEPIPFDGISCASWRRGPWIRRGQNERRNGWAACSRKEPQKCWGTSGAGESDLDRSTAICCNQWKSNKKYAFVRVCVVRLQLQLHGFPRQIKRDPSAPATRKTNC